MVLLLLFLRLTVSGKGAAVDLSVYSSYIDLDFETDDLGAVIKGIVVAIVSSLLIAVSCLWSLLSIIRGHYGYTSMKKNGFLPLFGKILLAIYIVGSICGRLFLVVFYFSPGMAFTNM
jgi:hypothetical protein